ncbi:hypothetical protein, partial [Pseudomonas syringae group genomosp. 3]|uniref:hypothetical protein n=1 Tax=Pseudomonas syringae group genomosp. 3 TaxID=251701 RepID=UPI001C813DCA
MDPYKRAHYVSRLASEIGAIGQSFEAFGGLVLTLALNHAREIYLLAGANKAPQISQSFETSVLGWPEMAGRSLKVLGAGEIAAVIIDHALDKEEAVLKLSHYLPSLARLSEEEAAQALVPQPDPLRIPRPEVDDLLDDLFEACKCVVLAGLGGSADSTTI